MERRRLLLTGLVVAAVVAVVVLVVTLLGEPPAPLASGVRTRAADRLRCSAQVPQRPQPDPVSSCCRHRREQAGPFGQQ